MTKKQPTNADKLLNYLDEIGELHNFFAELCFHGTETPSEYLDKLDTPSGYIGGAFFWLDTVDGHKHWRAIYELGELRR